MSNIYILPKLEGTNFNNWKFRVKAVLEEKQLEVVLTTNIASITGDKEKAEFKAKDSQAKSIIIQCVTDKHIDIIKDSKTAKEMVESLSVVFDRKSIVTKISLKRKLLLLKVNKNENLEDFFLRFDSLVRDLENTGSKLDESDKICHLLITLGEKYDTVITAIETLSTNPTMEFVKSRLLDEEVKIMNKEIIKSGNHEDKNNEVSFKANVVTCFGCGKIGHKKNECRYENKYKPGYENKYKSSYENKYKPDYYSKYKGKTNYSKFNNANRRNEDSKDEHHKYNKNENSRNISFIALNCDIQCDSENFFILDSGASKHLIKPELEKFMINVKELENEMYINTAKENAKLVCKKSGLLVCYHKCGKIEVEAFIVEGISQNLISIPELLKKGFDVSFKNEEAIIKKENLLMKCKKVNQLFILKVNYTKNNNCLNANENFNDDLWHRRLGHLNRISLKNLNLPFSNNICESCIIGKATRMKFENNSYKARYVGELIHSDISGPVKTPTWNDEKYFQVLMDDYSHFVIVKLLKTKSEGAQNLIDFIKLIKTQHGNKTKTVRCDNGGEFSSNYFKNFCTTKGIKILYTMPYTPQQNGRVERMNRTLENKIRTKFADTHLPDELWGEAVRCSAYELNRCPTSSNNGEIPAERWFKKKNDLSKLRIFGCKAYVLKLPKPTKLEDRAEANIMIGYCDGGYRLWNPRNNKIIQSREVIFCENKFNYNYFKEIQSEINEDSINIKENEEVYEKIEERNHVLEEERRNNVLDEENEEINQEERNQQFDQNENENEDDDDKLNEEENTLNEEQNTDDQLNELNNNRRSERIARKPKYLNDYDLYLTYCLLTETTSSSSQNKIPKNYEEAKKEPEWCEAMKKEINSLIKMETWTEIYEKVNTKPIHTRWIFKIKENGLKKARLVARGFEMDKDEIEDKLLYSPVARLSSIRLLLAHALQNNYIIEQLDIPSAFLNGILKTDVFIYTPEGFDNKKNILKLKRALYGLKEAPRVWNDKINKFAINNNLFRSVQDSCLYYGENIWMLIWVDDIILTGKTENIKLYIDLLKNEFNAKYLGKIKNFLGMEINMDENIIKINQKKMIIKTLKLFDMENCNGTLTPMESGFELTDEDKEIINVPIRNLIGCLLYLSIVSRPDITYSVTLLSRKMENPTMTIWKAGKRILRYLKQTMNLNLTYTKSNKEELKLIGYTDANWGKDKMDRKSISGGAFYYGKNLINWYSRKQGCVALSTAESEYIAAATSSQELMNIKGLLKNLNSNETTILKCDNQSAICMAKNYENSKRTKHVDIKWHYIRDLVEKESIKIEYVGTKDNKADIFTKALCKELFMKFRDDLNLY